MATPTPGFRIETTDGRHINRGDKNFTPLGDTTAVLESFDHNGDYVDLTYTGGLTVSIPETQIAYIATLDA
jgi:hypothetical protein